MIISVNNIIKGTTEAIEFSENFNLPNFQLLEPNIPINVFSTLFNDGDKFIFSAKVSAKFTFSCFSCLDKFTLSTSFDINEIYSKTKSSEDIFLISKNIIDFSEAIRRNIILNLPMKPTCSKNCKGLCHICGQNLNNNSCDCDTSFINPKFENILNLFYQKNTEV